MTVSQTLHRKNVVKAPGLGHGQLPSSDIAALYMLGVMIVAMRMGKRPTLLAAALATLAY